MCICVVTAVVYVPSIISSTHSILVFKESSFVRFSLPDGAFLPCDHGLDFDISLLRENSISSTVSVYICTVSVCVVTAVVYVPNIISSTLIVIFIEDS